MKPHETKHLFYPRSDGTCEESSVEVELVARSRPSSSHLTLPLTENGTTSSSLSGVWAGRAAVLGHAPEQDPKTFEQTVAAPRRTSTPTPPVDQMPRTPHPLSSMENDRTLHGLRGQQVQGAWPTASSTGAGGAVFKRSMTQPITASSPHLAPQRSAPSYFPSPSSSRGSSRSGTPVESPSESFDGGQRRSSGGGEKWIEVKRKERRPTREGRGGGRGDTIGGRGETTGGRGTGRSSRQSDRGSGYNRSMSDYREVRGAGGKQTRHRVNSGSSDPTHLRQNYQK